MKENIHQTNQIIGGMVAGENLHHTEHLKAALSRQDSAFTKAIEQIDKVRDFIGSPEHILGNNQTKHGEIAEQVEVGIRNARDYLRQRTPSATFDGVGRTAPEDYLIDGVQVQSKFINGINKNLDHVLEHMRKYENFGRDNSYYHIPEDYHETIKKVLSGESVEGLTDHTVRKIQQKVQEIEKLSGKSFDNFAASFVSAGQSIVSLIKSLNSGEISFDQFTEMSQLVCIESAAVGLASALGQAVIPVPVLGAVLGTIAGRMVIDFSKKYFAKETESLKHRMEEYYNQCLTKIDQTYQAVVSRIIAEYEKLGDLTKAAFDTSKNVALRLQASIELAEAYEVSDVKIIRNINELDAFMLS